MLQYHNKYRAVQFSWLQYVSSQKRIHGPIAPWWSMVRSITQRGVSCLRQHFVDFLHLIKFIYPLHHHHHHHHHHLSISPSRCSKLWNKTSQKIWQSFTTNCQPVISYLIINVNFLAKKIMAKTGACHNSKKPVDIFQILLDLRKHLEKVEKMINLL